MLILVCYDISNPKRLRNVAKFCERLGIRLQKSCFQLDASPERFKELLTELKSLINKKEDSILCYYICDDCFRQIKLEGPNELIDKKGYVIL